MSFPGLANCMTRKNWYKQKITVLLGKNHQNHYLLFFSGQAGFQSWKTHQQSLSKHRYVSKKLMILIVSPILCPIEGFQDSTKLSKIDIKHNYLVVFAYFENDVPN